MRYNMLRCISTPMALLGRNFVYPLCYPKTIGSRFLIGTNGNYWERNFSLDATDEALSDEKPVKGKGKSKNPTTRRKFVSSVVEPALELERTGDINSVVGIHIGTKSLYWVKVDRQRNVLEWSNADLFPTVDAGRKMTLPKLFSLMDGIAESIPFSDIFVLETPHQRVLSSVSSPAVIANAIFRSQMLAILLTILNLRLENEDVSEEYYHKVFLLKQRTVSRFFNLLIGSERVSALALMDLILGIKASHNAADMSEIMDENSQEGNQSININNSGNPLITPVNASSSIIESYRALGPVERESMSQALLSALAFYDLVVFKNPNIVAPLK